MSNSQQLRQVWGYLLFTSIIGVMISINMMTMHQRLSHLEESCVMNEAHRPEESIAELQARRDKLVEEVHALRVYNNTLYKKIDRMRLELDNEQNQTQIQGQGLQRQRLQKPQVIQELP